MSSLSQIDPNFSVSTSLQEKDLRFFSPLEPPFSLYGVLPPSGEEPFYRRLPREVAQKVNPGVLELYWHTAGGRVRFCTDSPYVAIHAKLNAVARASHAALSGAAGFDLYSKEGDFDRERFAAPFLPPYDLEDSYDSIHHFPSAAPRELTLNFPLYSNVQELYIGLHKDAAVWLAPGYRQPKPVVFYGSSITQGGCASRPGNSYQAILTRTYGWDHLNLGFSGSAKGEEAIAQYISGLDMSAFVYDYDHNAPNPQHLRDTHGPMFQLIRKAGPQLPILILSRPKAWLDQEEQERLSIIRATYENARAAGDERVFLLEGTQLFQLAAPDEDSCTVDGCHPNDLGFLSMARAIGPVLEGMLAHTEAGGKTS